MYRFKKINNADKYFPELIKKITQYQEIVALYLFGSFARGNANENSDIDLAIIFDKNVPSEIYFEKKMDYLILATEVLRTDEIDLIVLNNAPPSLAYRVFSEGKVLYENEEKKSQRVALQARVFNLYFDFMPVRKTVSEGLKRRIREGYFGGR